MMNPTTHNAIIADIVAKSIENGTAPWMKEYPEGHLQLPYNPTTGKPFTEQNALLLTAVAAEKNYPDPRWCSLNHAKEQQWTIKDNEKGIPIKYYAPDENNKITVKYFYVFNANQIDGMPPIESTLKPEVLKKNGFYPLMDNLGIKHQDIDKDYNYYEFKTDTMKVGKQSPENAIDLYDKIVQATGHKDRCNRSYYKDFDKTQAKELENATVLFASFLHAAEQGLNYSPKKTDFNQIKAILPVAIENAISAHRLIEKGYREKSQEQVPQKETETSLEM